MVCAISTAVVKQLSIRVIFLHYANKIAEWREIKNKRIEITAQLKKTLYPAKSR
jgi:hypothetical protein